MDPFVGYQRAHDGSGGFYLETTGGQGGWGYFGVEPTERVQVDSRLEDESERPTIAAIDSLLARETLFRGDCDVPFPWGAFGWLSYDVTRELEDIPDETRADPPLPQLQLGVFDCVAAWREPHNGPVTLHVTSCPRLREDVEATYERGHEAAIALARDAVQHLVSLVEGTKRPDASLADAIGAVFPGGTITGAPKPWTMEIIEEVEATQRGPYTGSIAMIGLDQRAVLNIIIRTLVRHNDQYHLQVGAGIVHDSDPVREYEETLDKAAALITAVDTALVDRASLTVKQPADSYGSVQ